MFQSNSGIIEDDNALIKREKEIAIGGDFSIGGKRRSCSRSFLNNKLLQLPCKSKSKWVKHEMAVKISGTKIQAHRTQWAMWAQQTQGRDIIVVINCCN